MPNNGRVTLPENITVSREHIQYTLLEQCRRSLEQCRRASARNFYAAVPLHVNSEGAITFQDPGKDKQKQLLSPFQQWEQTNNLTDLK